MKKIGLSLLLILLIGCSRSRTSSSSPQENFSQNLKPSMIEVPKGLILNNEPWDATLRFQDENIDTLQVRVSAPPISGTAQLSFVQNTWRLRVIPETASAGFDSLVVTATDQDGEEESFQLRYYIINPVAQSAFWIRSDDLVASGAGEVITSWKERITQQEAVSVGNNKRPRLITLDNLTKAANFQFVTGDSNNNDYLYYPSTYLFSQNEGITLFVVGKNKGFSSSIAPVISLGRWPQAGFGLSWNSQSMGLVTPTQYGGADEKNIINTANMLNQTQVVTAQILFRKAQTPGFQRLKTSKTSWLNGSADITLERLTGAEIDERPTPHTSQGAPIMIGGLFNSQFQPDRRFNGELSEVLIINQKLNDQEIDFLEKYFEEKYKL